MALLSWLALWFLLWAGHGLSSGKAAYCNQLEELRKEVDLGCLCNILGCRPILAMLDSGRAENNHQRSAITLLSCKVRYELNADG